MEQNESIEEIAGALVRELVDAGKTVATAESCTGGWVAKAVTDIPGSSGCFAYGIVSYSNEAKQSLLGVAAATLRDYGAVSEQTVREMATGVLQLSGADLAVAISGIAGPDGGSAEKPAGTVWFSWVYRGGSRTAAEPRIDAELHQLAGGREAVRSASVVIALRGLRARLNRTPETGVSGL